MIIDAVDLLYSNTVDACALMTSYSDFTPLDMRILENGMPVYGFGQKKTPLPFVHVCSQFIYRGNLQTEPEDKADKSKAVARRSRKEIRGDTALVRLLGTSVEQTSGVYTCK